MSRGLANHAVLLVVNPTARNGLANQMRPGVERAIRALGWSVETIITKSSGHATQIASAADPDRHLICALGGDGLLGAIAAGCLISGAPVAPLPAGRGHDFIRAIKAPREVIRAVKALPTAEERRYDVGLADGSPFLGVATVGYDSRANDYANNAPSWVPSSLVYAYGGARALLQTESTDITLVIDGKWRTFRGWNVAIGNSGRYGAGMKVNPDASLTDGLLDVTTVEGLPRWRFPLLLPRLFKGTHVDNRLVCADRGKQLRVASPAGWTVYADGDIIGRTPMTFTVARQALRVLAGVEDR